MTKTALIAVFLNTWGNYNENGADGGILITREENGTTEYIEEISAGDFVMLLNMYHYIKAEDIQNDFINPYGKIEEV